MSNDIKVGDLVWVARPTECCGVMNPDTPVFSVKLIKFGRITCSYCGHRTDGTVAENGRFGRHFPVAYQIHRLEKFRDFPESELREVSKELEGQS